MIKQGQPVTIKPSFRDDGDETVTFIAMADQDGDRVLIGALGVLHTFTPTQVVRVFMLDVAP
jgi:hypothetical protein